tara:strand:+ start:2691 stop:3965 length:1275 start_codon:yes stop_codon:yes gene_type:complete
MASEKFTKSVSFKTTDDEKGNVEAVFSVFNNLDSDGDVVLPGAIKSGFKDDQVPMVFAHKWDQPIGKGKIVQEDDKAVFKGKFFMGTEAGKEAYNLAKEMGDLQEWSFGFRINDYEVAEFQKDGESVGDVRYLKDLEVYEVSPVLVGANRQTYTLAIKTGEEAIYESSSEEKAANENDIFDNEEDAKKRAEELGCSGSHTHEVDGKEVYMPCSTHAAYEDAIKNDEKDLSEDTEVVETEVSEEKVSEDESSLQGVRFSDEVKDVLAALESLIVRAKAINVLRSKDGRSLSAKAESALRAVQSDLDDAWQELDEILGQEDETPEAEIDTEAEVAEAEVPVAEDSEAPVAEETEAEETEEEVSEESETVDVEEEEDLEPESEVAEDEVEEVVELEEVDAEFEALFAEAQATIADSYVAELEEDEEV